MKNHLIVSQDEWLAARLRLLAKEKELTRKRDQLSKERRALPWVKVEKEYVFHGPNGRQTLAQLFQGRSQLLIYHFMYGADWNEGCKSCSFWADSFNGITPHLKQRDVTMVVVSRAPYSKLKNFQKRMGWSFDWVSSVSTDFNHDFSVSIHAQGDEGDGLLQLRTAQVSPERGPWDQRVLQGRRGDDLPYILMLQPRTRSGEQGLSAARPGAQGSR